MQLGESEQETQRAVSKVKLGSPSPVKKIGPIDDTQGLVPVVKELIEELLQTLESVVEEGEAREQEPHETDSDVSGAATSRKSRLTITHVTPPPPTASIASMQQQSRRRLGAVRSSMHTGMATIDTEESRNVAVADAGIHEHLELLASATSSLDATWRELLQQSPGKNAAACASAEAARQSVCVCLCVCVCARAHTHTHTGGVGCSCVCVHVGPCVCVCVRACVCVCVCVSVLCAELLALKDKIIQWMEQHTTEQIERERERNRERERELEQFAGDQCLEIRRLRALLAQQEVMQPMTDVCASTVMRRAARCRHAAERSGGGPGSQRGPRSICFATPSPLAPAPTRTYAYTPAKRQRH